MKEEFRGLSNEKKVERMGLVKTIMENNIKMLEMQKTIENIKRQKEEEIRKKEKKRAREENDDDRWRKESHKRNEREREKREEQKRVEKEWRKIEKMRIKEERKTEKKWKHQKELKRRGEERRQIAMEERKCFACGGFRHRAYNYRNMEKEEPTQVTSNRFEVLKVRVIQKGEGSGKEVAKDRKEILREERTKKGVEVRQTKIEKKEKKEKYLREVTVKIRLKQEEEEEEVVTEALLDSGATGLVMSEEFARRHKFKRTKLEKPVYVRNVDGTLNYVGPIVDTVEVEIFFNGHKERTSIDVIGSQK